MKTFTNWLETVEYPMDKFIVHVIAPYKDQPTLKIDNWGSIRLFYSGEPPHWVVHMIRGEQRGAGTLLYFAALLWAIDKGEKILGTEPKTLGRVASDSTLSPDAVRARQTMQTKYGDYLYILPHPNADGVKIHRNDGSDWRRKATDQEATMWRLKKMPPFEFEFV